MLALGIEYLNGWAMASDPTDRGKPEWPPHPDRVYMAMAAAFFEAGESPESRAALEWLESLPPPQVLACAASEQGGQIRAAVTHYVPVNDVSTPLTIKGSPISPMGSLPFGRRRNDRQFPVVVLDDPVVHLVWPEALVEGGILAALQTICAAVTRVGHSASLVCMWCEAGVGGAAGPKAGTRCVWVPVGKPEQAWRGQIRVRVGGAGRLARLEQAYNKSAVAAHESHLREIQERAVGLEREHGSATGGDALRRIKEEIAECRRSIRSLEAGPYPVSQRPPIARWCAYRLGKPEEITRDVPSTCFRPDLIVLRCTGGRRLGLESTLQFTRAVHKTILQKLGDGGTVIPAWICGHKPDGTPSESDHLAIMPLAFLDGTHADGSILGVALVPPRCCDGANISDEEIGRTLGRILADEFGEPLGWEILAVGLGPTNLALDAGFDRRKALDPQRWTRLSRLWATVTPIVLNRHPKREGTAEAYAAIRETIREACERIGLPRPQGVEVAASSWVSGAPHGRQVPCMQRKAGGNRHHIHAIIDFAEPVGGPVLLGAGRYRGYGVCLPLSPEAVDNG